ncbi:MAG: hypothetical protein QNJ32_17275 [Xenococcaceae cyanobacterium MO_167.B27]|nr:hypothetical protein [Xenococcaceae cyanobacterium MO_167.B27]
MQSNHSKTVYLSFISTDLPLWNIIEAKASLYQKEQDKFHLLLNQQNLPDSLDSGDSEEDSNSQKGLLWLEISPYRVMMTMQSNSRLSYRHFWERGVYGISRYWLNSNTSEQISSFRLRNYTRFLKLDCNPFPKSLQVEYELWSAKLKLGSYMLHLDINNLT